MTDSNMTGQNGQNMQAPRVSLPPEQKRQRKLRYIAAATAITVVFFAGVGGMIFRSRSCMSEGCNRGPVASQSVAVAPAPKVPEWVECDQVKGMADPQAEKILSLKACGACDDGIIQINAEKGGPPYEENGRKYQKVRGRPSETEENCPEDYHSCSNGKLDRGVFHKIYRNKDVDGNEFVYEADILIYESCNPRSKNYCKADCTSNHKKTEKDAGNGKDEDDSLEPISPIRWGCAALFGSDRAARAGSQSSPLELVEADLRAAAQGLKSQIKAILTVLPEDEVVLSITMVAKSSGTVEIGNLSATCNGSTCSGSITDVLALLQKSVSFSGLTAGQISRDCSWTVRTRLKGRPMPHKADAGAVNSTDLSNNGHSDAGPVANDHSNDNNH